MENMLNLITPYHFKPKQRLIIELNGELAKLIERGIIADDDNIYHIRIEHIFDDNICKKVVTDYINVGWLNVTYQYVGSVMVWDFYL